MPRIGTVSGSVGQGLGSVSGRSWWQLVAVGRVNRSPVGEDLPPVGAVGWVVRRLLNQGKGTLNKCRQGSPPSAFSYSYPQV